ncbi:MAG: hypothetical protein IT318_22995 [Anaerolineales bacterium]|nr:hypothetical protein [Anaerolineales bacterium]
MADYEFANGHKPTGHGSWSFQLHDGYGASTQVFVSGRYTQAKQEAMRQARSLGCAVVTLNS